MPVRLCWFWDCTSSNYKKFGLIPPKDSIMIKYSESDYLLYRSLYPILTTLIVSRVVLLPILIILSRPHVNLLLFWSILLLFAFYSDAEWYQFLWLPVGWQRKHPFSKKFNSLFQYCCFLYILFLVFSSVYDIIKGMKIGSGS